jgi:hypothetical protein
MRVGAAQDTLSLMLAIKQAGCWKTTAVLLRYVKNARWSTLSTNQAIHSRK